MKAKKRTNRSTSTRAGGRQNEEKKRLLDELMSNGFNADLLQDQTTANLARKLEKYKRGEIVNDAVLSQVGDIINTNVEPIEGHFTLPKCYDALDEIENEKSKLYINACSDILSSEEMAKCRNNVYDVIMTDNDIACAKINIAVKNIFDSVCDTTESSLKVGDVNLCPLSSYSKATLDHTTKLLEDNPSYKLLLLTRPPKLMHSSKSVCDFITKYQERVHNI